MQSSGFVLIAIVACWVAYGLTMMYDSCCDRIPKITGFLYYHVITVQLLLSCHLIYSAFKAIFTSQIVNEFDAINIMLALFIIIYSIAMLGLLATTSYYTKIEY